MKIVIILLTAIFSINTFCAVPQTVVDVYELPTDSDMDKALMTIKEAKGARASGQIDLAEGLLYKSKKLLGKKLVKKTFNARVLWNSEDALQEDFYPESSPIDSNICYQGVLIDAQEMLSSMLESKFNWDEEFFQNVRIVKNKLLVDYIDGPNDLKELIEIATCR